MQNILDENVTGFKHFPEQSKDDSDHYRRQLSAGTFCTLDVTKKPNKRVRFQIFETIKIGSALYNINLHKPHSFEYSDNLSNEVLLELFKPYMEEYLALYK